MSAENNAPFGILAHHPVSTKRGIEVLDRVKAWLRTEQPGFICWAVSDPVDTACTYAQTLPRGTTYHIIPLLLFPGQHYSGEVQSLRRAIKEIRPDLTVRLQPCLLELPGFLDQLFGDL